MAQDDLVARRHLLFTTPDDATQRPCAIGITAPREVHTSSNDETLHDPLAACAIVFEGFDAPSIEVHGADSLQALAMACDIDPYLRDLERRKGYEFFWDDGTVYFEPSL
jgi:hypothetical protein